MIVFGVLRVSKVKRFAAPSSLIFMHGSRKFWSELGPSINGLVTDRNTKLSCRGFILALFQTTTANKIDSEHTHDYKRLLQVCEAEILRVTVKGNEVFSSFHVDF